MTVLGEAFIEVRGDVRPFVADLDREVKRAANAAEKALRDAIGNGLRGGLDDAGIGDRIADDVDLKVRKKFGSKQGSPWLFLVASLASALDDGISALPQEVKAALVGGILLATPLISGALAAAVTAGIGVGLAGIGTLIAFQFEPVREAGAALAENLQVLFLNAASAFGPAVLQAIAMIQARFQLFATVLNRIFTRAAGYVAPLTEGLLDLVDQVLLAIDDSGSEIEGFVEELSTGLRTLGFAIGDVLRTLAATGEDGRRAFRDLIFLVGLLLRNMADLIYIFTFFYARVRELVEVFANLTPLLAMFVSGSDSAAESANIFTTANLNLANAAGLVAQRTRDQEEEFQRLERAIDGATKAVYGIIESQIDFERSLDEISAALKENGATFDLENEKGRRNVEEFIAGLQAAEKEALSYTATGQMSAEQAAQYYDQQIAKLRALATDAGITGAKFDTMFGQITAVARLKLDANAMGITATEKELQDAVNQAGDLYARLQAIGRFRLPAAGTRRFSEYAEGGLVTHPTHALIGEAGPEVVIPLTKPARAAQLIQQSGLDGLLGGGATVVNVYVGNEQLDARTYRIVEQNNVAQSNSMAFGARGL